MKRRIKAPLLMGAAALWLHCAVGCSVTGTNEAATGAVAIDCIDLGNLASEAEHSLTADNSVDYRTEAGATARRFLPDRNIAWKAGECSFAMRVDSAEQNYFTLLLNGHESCRNEILLYINGAQIGYRGEEDLTPIYRGGERHAEGFYFATLPLPVEFTRGQSEVKIGLRCFGATDTAGVDFASYQLPVQEASAGVYAACTHTGTHCPLLFDEAAASPAPPSPDTVQFPQLKGLTSGETAYDCHEGWIALRDGDRWLCAQLYWRAWHGVNRLARLYSCAPTISGTATVYEDVARSYFCGRSYHRPAFIADQRGDHEWYRGAISANRGEKMLVSAPPKGTRYRTGERNPAAGRARCYLLQYGDYWMAMNRTDNEEFVLPLPKGGHDLFYLAGESSAEGDSLRLKAGEIAVIKRK